MIRRENSEEQFEKEWRDAFEGANETPPPSVWGEIDRQLTYAELSTYKSKTVFYRWAVAAIVVLAAALGTLQYYYFSEIQHRLLANSIDIDKPDPMDNFTYNWSGVNLSSKGNASQSGGAINSRANNTNGAGSGQLSGRQSFNSVVVAQVDDNQSSALLIDNEDDGLSMERASWMITKKGFEMDRNVVAASFGAPRKIPVYHFEELVKKKKTSDQEKYFAGVSFGSGGFDPNYQSTSGSLLSGNLAVNPSAFSLADNEAINGESPSVREGMLPGERLSLGVNFGMKLSDRWSLESGVQYARAGATTQTNVVIQTSTWQESIPATSQVKGNKQFESAVQREQIVEYDYRDLNLRNEFQFTSVPLTAGYLVVNSRFRVEVNAGLIANFYMGNKLTGHEEEIAQLTIGPGSQSPYRELSFSGLAGIELGYRLLKNFDLVLEPNYRQALNPLTKDDATFMTNPSGFGIMTGIKYNFN